MYNRLIFEGLKTHLADREVTAITGMRRTGKTTALQYLLEQVPHNNKLYIDLERLEFRRIFTQQNFSEMQADLAFLGIDFTKPAVIAIDEIQMGTTVASFIKYYNDY